MSAVHLEPRAPARTVRAGLEDVDIGDGPPYVLSWTEIKLLGIAGVGFFLDAYDLFIINPVAIMLGLLLYPPTGTIPHDLRAFLISSANIGSVIGQFSFGFAADTFGRRAVYGKELIIIIIATILCISNPTGHLHPDSAIIWLGCFRILLGFGVGGDYPMSASVSSDRMSVRKRGPMLVYIFANQGWGNLVGAIMVMVVLQAYKHVMHDSEQNSKIDGMWRICIGVSLIPAFGTLYQRLTLPDAVRYFTSKELEVVMKHTGPADSASEANSRLNGDDAERAGSQEVVMVRRSHWKEFLEYFSEWRHAKILIGTCFCWFFLDIAFYGINLNQNALLRDIGHSDSTCRNGADSGNTTEGGNGEAWNDLWQVGVGSLIIALLGFVPGYYATVLTIEKLGRKKIQIMGFLLEALFLAILAGRFNNLSKPAFILCFTLLQFFFNFGANATTYCYPAEVFPTRFRAASHGLSAACGKVGAIISAIVFNTPCNPSTGIWISVGCCLAGACFSFLLPEVMGRDPDAIDADEIRQKREREGNGH